MNKNRKIQTGNWEQIGGGGGGTDGDSDGMYIKEIVHASRRIHDEDFEEDQDSGEKSLLVVSRGSRYRVLQ